MSDTVKDTEAEPRAEAETPDAPTAGFDPMEPLDEACHQPLRLAWEEIETQLDRQIVETLENALESHAGLMAEAGLDGAPPTEWDTRAEVLLDYRRALASKVLEPVRDIFSEYAPLSSVATRMDTALERCLTLSAALPEAEPAPFRDGALDARPSDGIGRRVGKFFARGLSAARKPGKSREVPLRAVALRHLDRTVAPRVDRATAVFLTDLSEWTRALEEVLTEWGDEALPALVRAELTDHDQTADETLVVWHAIRDAGQQLQEGLTRLSQEAPHRGAVAAARARMAASREVLEADAAVAGSFLLRPNAAEAGKASLPRVARMAPGLEAWDHCVADRVRLYVGVLSILSGVTAVQRRLVWRMRERALSEAKVLPAVAQTLDALAQEVKASSRPVADRLQELEGRVEQVLEPTVGSIPDSAELQRAVDASSDAAVEALLAMVRQAPATLKLHGEDARLPVGTRKVETRTLALQELARQAFDALRIERIRSSTAGLAAAIDGVRDDVRELPDVFSFAYEAAKGELEEDEPDAQERAVGLVTEALGSMGESLRNGGRELTASVSEVQFKLATEIADGSLAMLDRIAAGRMQARFLAARSRFADLRALVNERWGPPVDRAVHWLAVRWGLLHRLVTRGVRRGSAIVSGSPSATAASSRTVKTLSEAGRVLAGLPLVYQRLFTLEPLTDGSLMAGRAVELGEAMERWVRWKSEDGVPLLVRGRPGCGVTSFLNVLGSKIETAGGRTVALSLSGRIDDEAKLAAWLADAFELEPVTTLDALSSTIFESPVGAVPDAVSVDNLEHLYLRVPKGTDLIERLLTLMSETEPRIFWIGGVTDSAWQLIRTTEPNAVSQIDILDLAPLDGEEIRSAINLRHRRSGLPVRFEEPASGRRLLRRRLRKLRDPHAYADLLERDFFDQLARASSGHLRLALFQWLLSADFDQGEGVVMRLTERPDFSLLEALSLTQNFTLKAFLEHRSLSLGEHDRIFRLPRHESYQIFEALQNRNLIENLETDDEDHPSKSEIEEDLRYRVRPLLVGAVTNHLRSRNIVH